MATLQPEGNLDVAVDDSDDFDSEYAATQEALSQQRRAAKVVPELRLQKALPCAFCPNVKPLNMSDWEAVVALENAAFPNPEHRASEEKVSRIPSPPV